MSTQTPLSLDQLEALINFDTLLEQAEGEVQRLAGRLWTDKGEHDPGVTLMQALAYAVSDVAYRHSLPLVDLLTPEDPGTQSGIFAAGFGPDQALTCGPVTDEDFRRALLDLHTIDGTPGSDKGFLFRNVQLQRDTLAEQFTYHYDPSLRQFLFKAPEEGDGAQKLSVAGTYQLYLELTAGVTRVEAEPILQAFLDDNRNLCEQVRQQVWVSAQDNNVCIDVDLDDDCTDPARVLANIYVAVLNQISPAPQRQSLAQLHEQGWSNDAVFQGPWLKHGWLTKLPAVEDYSLARQMFLTPLSSSLLAIDGVAGLRHLSWDYFHKPILWQHSLAAKHYVRAWGADPLVSLASGNYVRLFKRGQQIRVTAAEIQSFISPAPRYDALPVTVPYGRWRKPARYFWAGQRLPPCYGLHNDPWTEEQKQLHQFLLPFEQTLMDACSLLASLPDLLSFDRRGDSLVWGEHRWPFDSNTVPDKVHADYKADLQAVSEPGRVDDDKELAIVDYLLGYFGESRADRTLWTSSADSQEFLEVQQGYLRNIAGINYSRASLRIDEVSALQQRIAARLGFGSQLFAQSPDIGRLPFYIIEHRALLPKSPDPDYAQATIPTTVTGTNASLWTLTVGSSVDLKLQVGQLIDFSVTAVGETDATLIKQVMVSAVAQKTFEVEGRDHQQLRNSFARLISEGATITWQNSDVWLSAMSFRLAYSDQTDVVAPAKRLSASPYPLDIQPDDVILIEPRRELAAIKGGVVQDALRAKVTNVSPLQGTFIAEPLDGGVFPEEGAVSQYRWLLQRDELPDAFSFTVSVIFRRSSLTSVQEPELQAAWFEEVVRAEVPAHITVHVHWLDDGAYSGFAGNYAAWQENLTALGDRAYALLEALGIGLVPAGNYGIGGRRIASPDQAAHPWDVAFIEENELFYVPALD